MGDPTGDIKGDTRSLDYISYRESLHLRSPDPTPAALNVKAEVQNAKP